jgi:hypothetical protein
MKTVFSVLVIVGVCAAAHAQTAPGAASASTNRPAGRSSFQERLQSIVRAGGLARLAAMESRWGSVIVRRSTHEGSVNGECRINVLSISLTDARTNLTEYGIKVELTKNFKSAETGIAYVDHDDIALLLAGIDTLSQMNVSTEPFSDAEAAYTTVGGLCIAVTPTSVGKFKARVSVGRDRPVTARLTSAEWKKFRGLLESARARLDSARKGQAR